MEYTKIPLHHCSVGEILAQDVLNKEGVILVAKDTQINEFIKNKLLELGQTEVCIYAPLSKDGQDRTDICQIVRENYHAALKDLKNIIENLSADKAVNYGDIRHISEIIYAQNNESENIVKFLNEVKEYDDYTYTHSLNTAFYSMLICKWMKMTEDEVKLAIQAGLLHDIGKMDVPKEILNKNGILTRDEFEIIKKHTSYGYDRVNSFKDSSNISDNVRKAVLLHHERIDGTGYPFKIASDEISFFARIISVADVFDAMTSDRIYKKRSSPFEVFEMFKTVGVSMFDADMVNIFVKNIAAYYTDVDVLLNDGRTGRVVYIPPQDVARPVVKIDSDYLDLSKEDGIKLLRVI